MKQVTVRFKSRADFNSSIIVSILPKWRLGVVLRAPPPRPVSSKRDGEGVFRDRLFTDKCLLLLFGLDLIGEVGVEWPLWCPLLERLANSFSAVSLIERSVSRLYCLKKKKKQRDNVWLTISVYMFQFQSLFKLNLNVCKEIYFIFLKCT